MKRCILLLTLCAALLLTGCSAAVTDSAAAPTPSASAQPTATPTPTPSAEISPTATATPSPSATPAPTATPTAASAAPTAAPTAAPAAAAALPAPSTDGRTIYAAQIARYASALSEKWDMGRYYDNNMCEMVEAYYDGNPLDNVGVAFPDLNSDGVPELVIGAIYNSANDPVIFELWTCVNGTPVMLAQSHSRSRYFLDRDDTGVWFVSNEASNSAFSSGVYFYTLSNGALYLAQGILVDYNANPNSPWYMTYDTDWDVSNDTPIDEATYNSIWQSHSSRYQVFDYTPYSAL